MTAVAVAAGGVWRLDECEGLDHDGARASPPSAAHHVMAHLHARRCKLGRTAGKDLYLASLPMDHVRRFSTVYMPHRTCSQSGKRILHKAWCISGILSTYIRLQGLPLYHIIQYPVSSIRRGCPVPARMRLQCCILTRS